MNGDWQAINKVTIVQKLLDDKKITAAEALILLEKEYHPQPAEKQYPYYPPPFTQFPYLHPDSNPYRVH